MNDDVIVELFCKRNEQALIESAKKYGFRLKKISYNIVKNNSDVEECENDTYLSAWNNIPPKSPEQYLFSFFAKIIRNLSINLYNKNHRQKRFAHIVEMTREMEECIPAPNDDVCQSSDSDLEECISKFLKNLSEEEQGVFIRRYWYVDSVKDVAKMFDISESKTKSMLMRTRSKLKKHFIEEGLKL